MPVELDTRIKPRQHRAQRRIERILKATEFLLINDRDVTTSSIAAKADVPVGSVYRYFPNILAIYKHLFEDLNGKLQNHIEAPLIEDPDADWQILFARIMAGSLTFFERHPVYGKLLAMMSMPGLKTVKQACLDTTADIFIRRWHKGHDGFHGGDVAAVACTAAKLFYLAEQCYFERDQHEYGDAVFQQSVMALRQYLSQYLKSGDEPGNP